MTDGSLSLNDTGWSESLLRNMEDETGNALDHVGMTIFVTYAVTQLTYIICVCM